MRNFPFPNQSLSLSLSYIYICTEIVTARPRAPGSLHIAYSKETRNRADLGRKALRYNQVITNSPL